MTLGSQILRYLVVGGLITLADFLIYSYLTGPSRSIGRITANVLSTTFGMLLGFNLHYIVVFQPRVSALPVRVMSYLVTVACSVYLVQNLVLYVCADRFRIFTTVWPPGIIRYGGHVEWVDRMVGKLLATAVGMIWNFIGFKYFVYA